MTVPAIHREGFLVVDGPGEYWSYFNSCPAKINYGTFHQGSLSRGIFYARPASISTPRPKPGQPRQPTNWWVVDGSLSFPAITYSYNVDQGIGRTPCDPEGPLEQRYYWETGYDQFNGTSGDFWDQGEDPFDPHMTNECLIDLLNAIKNDSGVALGVDLAERRQTENMIVDKLQTITEQVTRYQSRYPGDWEHITQHDVAGGTYYNRGSNFFQKTPKRGWSLPGPLKKIPNAWLELQYGWKPLLSDVFDGVSAIEAHQLANDYVFSKEASGHRSSTMQRTVNCLLTRTTMDLNIQQYMKAKIYYRLLTSVLGSASAAGIANPLSIAWELVPYSFIVDWFMPVGNWLNTFDVGMGKQFVSGHYSQMKKARSTGYKMVQTGDYGPHYEPLIQGSPNYRLNLFRRTVLLDFPSPTLPALRNPCSPAHVANALSLLATAFGRGHI